MRPVHEQQASIGLLSQPLGGSPISHEKEKMSEHPLTQRKRFLESTPAITHFGCGCASGTQRSWIVRDGRWALADPLGLTPNSVEFGKYPLMLLTAGQPVVQHSQFLLGAFGIRDAHDPVSRLPFHGCNGDGFGNPT